MVNFRSDLQLSTGHERRWGLAAEQGEQLAGRSHRHRRRQPELALLARSEKEGRKSYRGLHSQRDVRVPAEEDQPNLRGQSTFGSFLARMRASGIRDWIGGKSGKSACRTFSSSRSSTHDRFGIKLHKGPRAWKKCKTWSDSLILAMWKCRPFDQKRLSLMY